MAVRGFSEKGQAPRVSQLGGLSLVTAGVVAFALHLVDHGGAPLALALGLSSLSAACFDR